jgi:hypothetical protein
MTAMSQQLGAEAGRSGDQGQLGLPWEIPNIWKLNNTNKPKKKS